MLAVLEHKPWAPEDGPGLGGRLHLEGRARQLRRGRAHREPGPGGAAAGAGWLRGARRGADATPAADRLPARRPRSAVLEARACRCARRGRAGGRGAGTHARHAFGGGQGAARAPQGRAREDPQAGDGARAGARRDRPGRGGRRRGRRPPARRARRRRGRAGRRRWSRAMPRVAEAEEARGARDEVLQKLSAVEGERDALAEARDRARLERNAWMSRARAAATGRPSAEARAVPKPLADRGAGAARRPHPSTSAGESSPSPAAPPPSERRTIQIGERPGPVTPKPPASPLQDRGSASYLRDLGRADCCRAGPGRLRRGRRDRAPVRSALALPRRRWPASEPAPAPRRAPRRSSSPGGRSSRRGPPPARRRGRRGCARAGSRP